MFMCELLSETALFFRVQHERFIFHTNNISVFDLI
jgi:hypothetical protein